MPSTGCLPAVSRHCHAERVSCVTLCHGQWVVYLHTVPVSPPYCILPHSSFHSDVTSRETQSEGLVLVGHPVLTSTPFHHSTHQLNTAHCASSLTTPTIECLLKVKSSFATGRKTKYLLRIFQCVNNFRAGLHRSVGDPPAGCWLGRAPRDTELLIPAEQNIHMMEEIFV